MLATLERCYQLIQETHERESAHIELPANSVPGSASSIRTSVTSYLAKFLTRPVFEHIKRRQTRLDHNLFDVIWPAMKKIARETPIYEDLNAGIVVPDFNAYIVFHEFLEPLIKDLHNMDPNVPFTAHPDSQFYPHQETELSYNFLDASSDPFLDYGVIEICRNLEDFELPFNLTLAQLEQTERLLLSKLLNTCFSRAIGEEKVGTYYTISELTEHSQIYQKLDQMKIMIPILDINDPKQLAESVAINNDFWPYGRGVFVSENCDLVAWINVQDHLRLLCSTKLYDNVNISMTYNKISKAIDYLSTQLDFRHSHYLGYLSCRPSFLGTAMKIRIKTKLPHLGQEMANLRYLCTVRGVHLASTEKDDEFILSNMQSLSTTEWRIIDEFCYAIMNILQLEKDLQESDSDYVTDTFIKFFKKRHENGLDKKLN